MRRASAHDAGVARQLAQQRAGACRRCSQRLSCGAGVGQARGRLFRDRIGANMARARGAHRGGWSARTAAFSREASRARGTAAFSREAWCARDASFESIRTTHERAGMEKKRVFGTGGELLVHQLVAQGVPYAFTNTGSAEAGFFNALLTVPGVQPILLLAESLVLSAADGYAKASRKPAFVNVHLAAGTRQGSGQLQNAYFDGTPMVVTAAMRDVGILRRPRRAGGERGLLADGHRGGHHEAALGSVGRGRDPDRHAPRVQGRDDVPDGPRLRGVCQLRAGGHQRGGPDPGRGRPAHGPGAGRERHPRDLGRAAQCREALAGLRAGHRGGGRGGRDPDAGRAPRAAGGHRHLRLRQLPRASPELCGRRRDPLRGRL